MALRNSIDFASISFYKYLSSHLFAPMIAKRRRVMMISCSLRRNLLFGGLLLILGLHLLSGCAANVTRSRPFTQVRPDIIDIAPNLRSCRLGIVLFDHKDTKIEGGHHEGLLQVRQPWIFGISKAQKDMLYGNAGELAALSLASELKNQGLSVTLLEDVRATPLENFDLVLTGKVERVLLNTYGHGTKEGFGSAGNYWEATVFFSNIQLKDTQSDRVFRVDDIQSYAKLENCPAQLDWTMLTVAVKSLQGALLLYQIQTASSPLTVASKGKKYVETFKADYTVDKYVISPIEVAARHAAAQFLQRVKSTVQ
jgi:hypothetical protein